MIDDQNQTGPLNKTIQRRKEPGRCFANMIVGKGGDGGNPFRRSFLSFTFYIKHQNSGLVRIQRHVL